MSMKSGREFKRRSILFQKSEKSPQQLICLSLTVSLINYSTFLDSILINQSMTDAHYFKLKREKN